MNQPVGTPDINVHVPQEIEEEWEDGEDNNIYLTELDSLSSNTVTSESTETLSDMAESINTDSDESSGNTI